jgi:serine/threonine protein kinase/Tol biopolymer transport system component
MPLTSGTRLGPYEVLSTIGSGGMGEVYRARDTRLNRDVAIKVLPDLFARDPERLARFEREAQAIAALSHPNILAIHDFGSAGGTAYAAMELLEGHTVRARLADGPIAVRKAIEYAAQFARGLAAAHDKGIVHRDLKPENLFITTDERAKILDFGLARQTSIAVAAEETFAPAQRTEPGAVLGTIGYMAPEQVRGDPGDPRSDIFSFGVVLYEMVTGRRAFHRESAAETMTAIVREEPPDLEGEAQIPAALARIIWHCLEKKPDARFRSAQDLAFALETISRSSSSSSRAPAGVAAVAVARSKSRRSVTALAAVAILIAATAGAFWIGRHTAVSSSSVAAPVIPTFKQLTFDGAPITRALFAPDGQTVIYSAEAGIASKRVFLTRLDSRGSKALSLPASAILSISPTSELALVTEIQDRGLTLLGTLARVPLLGGAPRPVLENVTFADWHPITGALAVVRIVGSRERLESPPGTVMYETDGEVGWPRFSPKGDSIAFLDWPVKHDDRGTVAIIQPGGAKRTISRTWEAVKGLNWSPSGDEVWYTASAEGQEYVLHGSTSEGRERVIYRAPDSLLLQDVRRDGKILLIRYDRSVLSGALAEGDARERDLSWLGSSWVRDLSRDGRQVALSHSGAGSGADYDVYVRGIDGSEPVLVGQGEAQQFSPDGRWVLSVQHGPPVRLVMLPVGAGERRTVSTGNVTVSDARWMPDGRRLVVAGTEPGHGRRLYLTDVDGAVPRAFTPDGITFASNALAVSPDGARVVLRAPDGRVMLYPTDKGEPTAVPGLSATEMPIAWTADGRAVLVAADRPRGRIDRIDLASARRDRWLDLRAADPLLLGRSLSVVLPPGSRSYIANYQQIRTTLYLAEGLQ